MESKYALNIFRVIVLVSLLHLASCKKNISGVNPPNIDSATSMINVFEDYWTGMNTNYVFWDIDTTKWDRVYTIYRDSFSRLDINNTNDVATSYRYFKEMTNGLIDGHYQMWFFNPNLVSKSISPASSRKHLHPSILTSFFSIKIIQNYLSQHYEVDTAFTQIIGERKQFDTLRVISGLIDPNIVYLRFNMFYLSQFVNSSNNMAWNFFLTNVRDTNNIPLGIIIDLRSNSGGLLSDLNFLVGELINRQIDFAYTKEKSGNGRLDYTPWIKAFVTPASDGIDFKRPIVILTDQHSVSMAEMTTMALKVLPNTFIIGDTTWGANGPLNSNVGPNNSVGQFGGGQFEFGYFGYVYTSSAQYKYIDGKIYEGKGFPPDKYVAYNADSIAAGRDIQLQAAIDYVKSH